MQDTATLRARFGPWSPDLSDAAERKAQLRCLAGIVACHRGSADPLIDALRAAELDRDALERAAAMLDRVPSLTLRRVISTFGSVTYRRAP